MSCKAIEKRRLLFLTVNCSYSHSSLALPLLHSACRELTQWEWLRYDMTSQEDVMEAVRAIASLKCDLLVSNLYLFNRATVLEILQRYHILAPECRIAVGGPECLGDGASELLQSYPWLDRVFRGEGEEWFRTYLENFDASERLPGKILPAQGNAVFTDWAASPFPVTDPFFVTEKPFVQMESSRGCPMKCFYCTSGGSQTRYRTLEQLREELHLLESKGVKEVRMLDRTFNLPQERGSAILRMFREEFPGMRFHLELHPQFLNGSLQQELLQARPGQLHIEAGIQCLDQEVQRLSGRNSSVSAALEGMRFLCKSAAFETHADLLAGLPGQRWSHILADAAELMKIDVAEIQLEVLKVLPGTPMRHIAEEHGIKYSAAAPYDVMMTNTMTLDEIEAARDLSRLLDMTYNHKKLHGLFGVLQEEKADLVPALLKFFHESGGSSAAVWDLKKRFLFLADFCRVCHLAKSEKYLAYLWLLAGFPPEQGADSFSRKSSGVPAGAELLSGDPRCAGARETRYWSFAAEEGLYILAYNRTCSLNGPAAVWKVKKDYPERDLNP